MVDRASLPVAMTISMRLRTSGAIWAGFTVTMIVSFSSGASEGSPVRPQTGRR
jgi:hypothetical protein